MESRLLALPCELRLQVYENALVSKSTSFRIRPVKVRAGDSPHNTKFRSRVSPALLRSCRQIHEEAIAILYSKNRFLAASAGGLIQFLSKIGRNAKFLRWLKVRLGDLYSSMYSTWEDSFALLAKVATALSRLEIGYMENMRIDRDATDFLQHGLGKNTVTARIMGEWITKMHKLRTLVISGFYGKNRPAFFATKTNAVVEAYAGARVRLPGPGMDSEKYRKRVERARRQLEAYQENTDDLLASDVEEEAPMLPGWMFNLTVSD